MKGTLRRSVALASAIVATGVAPSAVADESSTAPSRGLEKRGSVIVSAERVLPIATVSAEHGTYPRTTTQVGLGPLIQPNSIHEVPRLAIDFVVADRLTLGLAPIFTYSPRGRAGDGFAIGVASRIGYLLSLSTKVLLWPHAGPAFAYVTDFARGSQLMLSGEIPFVFVVADHAALSLGVSGGTALTKEKLAGDGPTNLATSYAGLNGGLLAWF